MICYIRLNKEKDVKNDHTSSDDLVVNQWNNITVR